MGKYSKQIILLALTLVMAFTGVGVNVIEYCCSGCKAESSLLPIRHDCCSNLQLDNNEFSNDIGCHGIVTQNLDNSYAANNLGTCDNLLPLGCCTISRIFFDIEYVYSRHILEKPLIFQLDFLCFSEYMTFNTFNTERVSSYFDHCYWQKPRNYLSLISVLII